MKILHLSDSHGFHNQLNIDEKNLDIIIHSGDESNSRDPIRNEVECLDFIKWYNKVNVKYKIFIAGNHSTAIEKGYINKTKFEENGIIYLENESIEIMGLKIWGSPYTPSFGLGWSFNKARHKIGEIWDLIPKDTDIIITHGPPKGVLDLSYDKDNVLEYCGCKSLLNKCLEIRPKLVCFGHIHNSQNNLNAGYRIIDNCKTIFSNGSLVEDGKFSKGIINNGNIFEL